MRVVRRGETIVRKVKAAHLPTRVTVICTGTDDEVRIKAVQAPGVEFGEIFATCQATYCR